MIEIIATLLAAATLITTSPTPHYTSPGGFTCLGMRQCVLVNVETTDISSITTAYNTTVVMTIHESQFIPFQDQYVNRLYLVQSLTNGTDVGRTLCRPSWTFDDGTGAAGIPFGWMESSSSLSVERSKNVTGVQLICNMCPETPPTCG